MQDEANENRIVIENFSRDAAEPSRSGGMRARRSDHHRTHHIED
jgi:hypothetical protein